jgi:hypothetical protein
MADNIIKANIQSFKDKLIFLDSYLKCGVPQGEVTGSKMS